MLKGYDLKLESYDHILTNGFKGTTPQSYINSLEQKKKDSKKVLSKFMTDKTINGNDLMEEWFPQIKNNQVFISHSSRDKDLARYLSYWLYSHFGIESFIDSDVWGYSHELLKELDKTYAWKENSRTYDYDIRNATTSHVHMMLSTALNATIDSCECLIFLHTDNSIVSTEENHSFGHEFSTESPWIMSELNTSSVIRRQYSGNRPRPQFESYHESVMDASIEKASSSMPKIQYGVPTEHLKKIQVTDLVNWKESTPSTSKSFDALDILYSLHDKSEFKDLVY